MTVLQFTRYVIYNNIMMNRNLIQKNVFEVKIACLYKFTVVKL